MTLTTTRVNGRTHWRAQRNDANGHRHSESLNRTDRRNRRLDRIRPEGIRRAAPG